LAPHARRSQLRASAAGVGGCSRTEHGQSLARPARLCFLKDAARGLGWRAPLQPHLVTRPGVQGVDGLLSNTAGRRYSPRAALAQKLHRATTAPVVCRDPWPPSRRGRPRPSRSRSIGEVLQVAAFDGSEHALNSLCPDGVPFLGCGRAVIAFQVRVVLTHETRLRSQWVPSAKLSTPWAGRRRNYCCCYSSRPVRRQGPRPSTTSMSSASPTTTRSGSPPSATRHAHEVRGMTPTPAPFT